MKVIRSEAIFHLGVILSILLVLFGIILVPGEGLIGVVASISILIVYAFVAHFFASKVSAKVLPIAIKFGILAGLVFAGEIILEYILLPKDNTPYGLIEFGLVFVIYLLSGAFAAFKIKSIKSGIITAVATAMISTLIWAIVFLSVFYLFYGTPQQILVHQAEGDYLDFARSGARDFNVFVMQDYMGAVFYHSLIGPVIASVLGLISGLTIKFLRRKK